MLSTLSYQAVFQAFSERIVGSVRAVTGFEGAFFHTGLIDTVLANAEEL